MISAINSLRAGQVVVVALVVAGGLAVGLVFLLGQPGTLLDLGDHPGRGYELHLREAAVRPGR